jgi:pimeloyl-ACP methyl ester carboxylesterase
MQNTALGRASGLSEAQIAQANELNRRLYDIALEDGDAAILQKKILDVLENAIDTAEELTQEQKTAQKEKASLIAAQLVSPWMRSFFAIDPSEYLKQMRIPVLALNGSKDLQVPASENLAAIRAALESAGNRSARDVDLDGLNHLFQHATTGLPSEYGEIKETFAPEALALIGDWILKMNVR